jgi:hypothetical protein
VFVLASKFRIAKSDEQNAPWIEKEFRNSCTFSIRQTAGLLQSNGSHPQGIVIACASIQDGVALTKKSSDVEKI